MTTQMSTCLVSSFALGFEVNGPFVPWTIMPLVLAKEKGAWYRRSQKHSLGERESIFVESSASSYNHCAGQGTASHLLPCSPGLNWKNPANQEESLFSGVVNAAFQ